MRVIDTESVKCPRCKVELDVPFEQEAEYYLENFRRNEQEEEQC